METYIQPTKDCVAQMAFYQMFLDQMTWNLLCLLFHQISAMVLNFFGKILKFSSLCYLFLASYVATVSRCIPLKDDRGSGADNCPLANHSFL